MGNTLINCKVGIAVTSDGGTNAPLNCLVIGNTITNSTGGGISFTGAEGLAVGSPYEYATGVIQANILTDCGTANSGISGAIYMRTTKGLLVSGNILKRSRSNGFTFYYDNADAILSGNSVTDVYDNDYTAPAAVALRDEYNSITITGNSFLTNDASLGTYANNRGVYASTLVNNSIIFGKNKNSTFEFPYIGFRPNSSGDDGENTVLYTDSAEQELGIGGNPIGYKLNIIGTGSGHEDLILARNHTAGERANIQVSVDTAGGGFKAFSSTFGAARKADKVGIDVDSDAAAVGIWAEGVGQTFDIYAGGTTLIGRFSSTGLAITGDATVTDEAYGAGWNASLEVPTKNAIYDEIESLDSAIAGIQSTNASGFSLGDMTSEIVADTDMNYWVPLYDGTIVGVIGSVFTASSSGVVTYDIHLNGTSIMTTSKLVIDENETSTVTAATAPVLTTVNFSAGDRLTFDIDTDGTGAVGPQIGIYWKRR